MYNNELSVEERLCNLLRCKLDGVLLPWINVTETEVGIKNKQPKDTGNTGHRTQNEHKQNKQAKTKTNKQKQNKKVRRW
jgi:hypothetical protein